MRKFISLIILSLSWMSAVLAVPVAHLNDATVAVGDRSQASLAKVAPEALSQVFIKISGNPSVVDVPPVAAAITQAMQYVQSFGYTTSQSQLRVRIQFDRAAMIHALTQADQSVWRADRPVTLAWVHVDAENNAPTPILSSDEDTPVISTLRAGSDRWGLPMLLPSMDIQDQDFINANASLPFDVTKLAAAGKRYSTRSILAGNLTQSIDGSWQGQWLYLLAGEPHQWNTAGKTQQEVVNAAIADMDGIISSTLAARDDTKLQTAVKVHVLGVINLNDYALIMSDLKYLNAVAHVDVSQLQGSTLALTLEVIGGKAALMHALKANHDLSPMSQEFLQDNKTADLFYQFNSNPETTS